MIAALRTPPCGGLRQTRIIFVLDKADEAQQPVWNPKNDRFYQAVPAITGINTGSIDIINPLTRKVERSLITGCSPAGLVLTPSQRLKTSCGEAFDAITGDRLGRTEEGNPSAVAADQLWYNPGDNNYYFGFFNGILGGRGCAVVDANTNQLLTFIPASTHTLAADPNYNRIFIPVTGSGIQVWAAQ